MTEKEQEQFQKNMNLLLNSNVDFSVDNEYQTYILQYSKNKTKTITHEAMKTMNTESLRFLIIRGLIGEATYETFSFEKENNK